MPAKNPDLHGNVPEKCSVALLLVDVINDLEFEGSEALVEQVVPMAHRTAMLKRRCKAAGIPVVYVNDNFGRWKSDFHAVVEHCLQDRKSTRLNSSHSQISYAVFCLKKKK